MKKTFMLFGFEEEHIPVLTNFIKENGGTNQGFSSLSGVRARGLLNLGKKHFDHKTGKILSNLKQLNPNYELKSI